jgi:pSer/pThr/pTyr-binding forkhead associated (FHA) protein
MRSRILIGILFGAAGGFLGFLLQERLLPHSAVLNMTARDLMLLGAYVGGSLGMFIGAMEGTAANNSNQIVRGAVYGLIVGVLGGMMGAYLGGVVYSIALFGKDQNVLAHSSNILDFTHAVIARALGWTFFGALPGLAAGVGTRSRKRALHGLCGGLLGGFLGGIIFDLVANVVGVPSGAEAALRGERVVEIGGPSRAIGITAIGALTGLFIGLVEELLKQAWVRVLAGRNEGVDVILSKPLNVLGRDERAEVPLFGDPMLTPQHAAIKGENGRHYLLDGGAPPRPLINGQPMHQQEVLLRDGDMIQLGQVRLLFREKATASRAPVASPDRPRSPQAAGAVSMPSHLCPFCGSPKDAQGNCQCTVPGASPAAMPALGASGSAMPPPVPLGMGDPYASSGSYMPPAAAMSPTPMDFSGPSPGGMPFGMGTMLVGMEGPYTGQAFPLNQPTITIGRDASRDIALIADTTISRRHAHIGLEGGQHVLYDDGSSNGTFVNNVRISVQPLAPGDIVQFGAGKFRYE